MAIQLINNSIQSDYSQLKKISEKYSAHKIEKQPETIKNSNSNSIEQIKNTPPKELHRYLSSDEIKVLESVFGDTGINKKLPNFISQNNVSLLKGSKIDILL